MPSVGVSNNPRMASSVDLPQPEGPPIDRYSPFATSMWIADSACVSTSSVTKTLLTASSRSSGCEPLSIVIYPFYESRETLVQLNSVVTVVGRHIREYHLVSHLESVLDFDGIHRTAPQHHLHLVGVLAVRLHLEELNRALLLPENRPSDKYHIVQPLQLDGAIHAQIRPRALRQAVLAHQQRHIYRHRAVEDRGIDTRYAALYMTITRVDVCVLTYYDVFYLCFGDFQLRFQLGGLGHLAQRGAGGHLLAHFHGRGQLLQYAIESGADVEL